MASSARSRRVVRSRLRRASSVTPVILIDCRLPTFGIAWNLTTTDGRVLTVNHRRRIVCRDPAADSGEEPAMTDSDLPLVDAHQHLWNLDENYYPWLSDKVAPAAWGSYDALLRNYTTDDYLRAADAQNLVKSVHLDVGWDPRDPVGETRWLQQIADQHGFPHGIVGYADLSMPDVAEVLDAHAEHANFRGIRQSMNYHP